MASHHFLIITKCPAIAERIVRLLVSLQLTDPSGGCANLRTLGVEPPPIGAAIRSFIRSIDEFIEAIRAKATDAFAPDASAHPTRPTNLTDAWQIRGNISANPW